MPRNSTFVRVYTDESENDTVWVNINHVDFIDVYVPTFGGEEVIEVEFDNKDGRLYGVYRVVKEDYAKVYKTLEGVDDARMDDIPNRAED